MAELRYIDHATEYLEGMQAEWYHYPPIGEHIVMNIEFGPTVPFVRTYTLGAPAFRWPWETMWAFEEEVNARLGELAAEAGSWAADNIVALSARIAPFTYPSTDRYTDDLVVPLHDTLLTLEDDVSTDFGKLSGSVVQWEGDAADNFRSYFYEPFEDTLRSHRRLVEALTGGVLTAKAIVDSTQHSLMNAVHYTSELLHHQLVLRSQDKVEDKTLPIVILAAGGLASIMSAGAATPLWALGMESVAVGVSLAASTIPEGAGLSVELLGSKADALLDSLDDVIGRIERNIVRQHDQLAEHVQDVLERIELLRMGGDADDGRLVPLRPTIVDGVDADAFRLGT